MRELRNRFEAVQWMLTGGSSFQLTPELFKIAFEPDTHRGMIHKKPNKLILLSLVVRSLPYLLPQ